MLRRLLSANSSAFAAVHSYPRGRPQCVGYQSAATLRRTSEPSTADRYGSKIFSSSIRKSYSYQKDIG